MNVLCSEFTESELKTTPNSPMGTWSTKDKTLLSQPKICILKCLLNIIPGSRRQNGTDVR